jgi:PAS domain S-box-containing protein
MPDDRRPSSPGRAGHTGTREPLTVASPAAGRRGALVDGAVRASGTLSALIGATYLGLWLVGIAGRWSASGALTMKTNMALSLLAAGVGLLLTDPARRTVPRRVAATIAGLLVLLVGVLTLSEHLLHVDLGIDQLIASEVPGARGTASPNRIGVPGSVSLALLGAGLVSATWRRRYAAYLGLATGVIVIVPALGFLYGVSPFYATRTGGIAWITVLALLALAVGLVLDQRGEGPLALLWRDDPGGVLLRRLLVPSLLIPIVLGYFRVQGERVGLYSGPVGTVLYALALILLLFVLLWGSARKLSAFAALRQRATDQLAAEKERLSVTLRSIGDAVIATDAKGRVTLVNGVAEALTRWKAEEAMGRPLPEVFHIVNEHTREVVESPVERVLREGTVVGLANHTALIARDGTERPIADSGAPIRDAEGRVAGVVLVFRDQTEERAAEAVLRSERERAEWLASFPARNPVPIVEVDSEGAVRYANAAAETLFPDLRGLGSMHPWLAGWAAIVRAFREDDAPAHERILTVGDRSYQQAMYYVAETGCIRIYGTDVTERARAEAALRDSEEGLRALADSMPQLAWTARPDGYITWYNRRWHEYTGTTPQQVEGWGWQAVHDPAALPEVLRRWTASIASGEVFEMEFPLRRADGVFRRFLTRGSPLKSGDGKVLRWFGTNTDVTELVETRDALREASRRKDEFLAMLSHELRNPLAPIRNAVHLLERVEPAGEQAARARGVIARQAEHLSRIVDDLLDMTRIARGKIELHRSRVDLRALVAQATEDVLHVMKERQVAVHTTLPAAEVWAEADPTRIAQLVGNLLHNAAKFTRPGDEVSIALRTSGDAAEISVRDTGIGIDPALLPQVFDAFVQGERTLARTEGGLGLGLAVVKAVAELHGGAVRAESPGAGRGATFVVRLPVATPTLRAEPAPAPAPGARRRRHVLVVDDNRDAAETLADIVTMLGHEAAVAFDGPGAIQAAGANGVDCVLCDIGLPGISGYDVARALRSTHGPALRLIAVSGYAQADDVKNARDAGFDGHLAKPFDPAELERLLA